MVGSHPVDIIWYDIRPYNIVSAVAKSGRPPRGRRDESGVSNPAYDEGEEREGDSADDRRQRADDRPMTIDELTSSTHPAKKKTKTKRGKKQAAHSEVSSCSYCNSSLCLFYRNALCEGWKCYYMSALLIQYFTTTANIRVLSIMQLLNPRKDLNISVRL